MVLFSSMLVAALAVAEAAPQRATVDVGRPGMRGQPIALIVTSPGVAKQAYVQLADELEAVGFDAHRLVQPSGGAAPPLAAQALRSVAPPALVVGHGLGGIAVIEAAAAADFRPGAIALLGVPLALPATPLHTWLASLPLPTGGIQPADHQTSLWQGHAVLSLLLGEAPPPLERVGASVLADLHLRAEAGWTADLMQISVPLWVGLGAMDELAPVEALPALPPDAQLHRFGMLHGWLDDASASDLLVDRRPARRLARWGIRTVTAPPRSETVRPRPSAPSTPPAGGEP